jgi:hypothetical protein
MPLPKAFASALKEVKVRSRIPILLPSKLPAPVANAKYGVVETVYPDEYAISLYYELYVGDSGFAASFVAKAHPGYGPKDLLNVSKVKLFSDLPGYFRPVSCGCSCAPANLWWWEGQVLYQIQLKLPSTLPENDQQKIIVETANSAIIAGPR